MASVKDFSVEEKLVNLYRLQRVDSSIDEIEILRGELPMEVKDLEDEVLGLQNRQTRIEEEINGITEFIDEKKAAIKTSEELIAKYEKQIQKLSQEEQELNSRIEVAAFDHEVLIELTSKMDKIQELKFSIEEEWMNASAELEK